MQPRKARSEGDVMSQKSGRSNRSRGSHSSSRTSATSRQPLAADGAAGAMVFIPPSEVGSIGSIQEKEEDDPSNWKIKLCCGSCSCATCMLSCFCVPCAGARARNRFDGSGMCLNIFCLNLCVARNYIRRGYGIKGNYCGDLWLSVCCAPCVACQILGETEERGFVFDRWAQNPHRTTFQQPWKFGLCSFWEDLPNCGYGCCCPPCAVGSIRTGLDGSDCFFNCCFLSTPAARNMVRKAYNIEGSDCGDCCMCLACGPCVMCQMLNEVQHRGRIDMDSRGILGGPVVFGNSFMKR